MFCYFINKRHRHINLPELGSHGVTELKRKRRLADRLLTKTVREIIPESESYMELLEVEKKLDFVLMRKRLTLQEAMKKPFKVKRKLRVMLSSTFKPGSTVMPVGSDAQTTPGDCAPGWELKVEGQLLDKPGQPSNNDPKCRRKFSSFFKSLVIELDRELYGPDNHLVEWHRTATTAETDGFQVYIGFYVTDFVFVQTKRVFSWLMLFVLYKKTSVLYIFIFYLQPMNVDWLYCYCKCGIPCLLYKSFIKLTCEVIEPTKVVISK
ncbi:unnamed protein product [Schistosoma mattheei]|uniref:SWIB domain-containing protein n=1 Tax=Schistosoma mattheei TaxID=31246 RepID=A0A3P7YM80_9TREM|nr:unnamed protein product [Schistosoma mattheei]